jgi:hypothetical protein
MGISAGSIGEPIISWLSGQDIKHRPVFLDRSRNVFSYSLEAKTFHWKKVI